MEVYFNSKDPEELYRTGYSKKLKLPVQVVDKFFATIQKIEPPKPFTIFWRIKGCDLKS
ncbi:MAG: hypothetical protein IPG32_01135 [Saprospirales bacterium]|nr:hypothetical protein [Saprospirales bacterium]